MKRLKWLTMLMGITLLVITGFQVYWLKNNYDREKRSMQIRTNVAFQETIRHLQGIKLKIADPDFDTSHNGRVRVMLNDEIDNIPRSKPFPRKEIVSMVNVMRDKIKDTLIKAQRIKGGNIVISMDKGTVMYRDLTDSLNPKRRPNFIERRWEGKGDGVFRFLYGIDSLQDSIRINEINKAYAVALKNENINVPFTILRLDTAEFGEEPDMSKATVGFAHPVTYKLEISNSFSYLMKKITLPILFSIFLVGVTVLSFVLLYRSLLRQQRLAAIKNEFISNITHELKTPIATVGVAIEALKNFNAMHDPQKTREYLDISSNELQRLSLLVDKVLKLSMFEKKEIELKYETLNLKEVVDEVVSSLRLQIEKHHARVSVSEEGDINLQADKLHLLSIVFNLLDNALKYSKGDPSIQIELKGAEDSVTMSVIDNGIGIAPEYKDKVFEKFFRVPTGNTHNAKGYGLGLSYVSHVVQKHKGNISIESQPGIGTRITISLPKLQA